jgi:hypothetical protein
MKPARCDALGVVIKAIPAANTAIPWRLLLRAVLGHLKNHFYFDGDAKR